MRRIAPLILAAGCLLVSACGGISDPSKNTTQDFPPTTIQPFGGAVHEFDVSARTGEYSATIIAITPTQSSIFSIFLGTMFSGSCAQISGTTFAKIGNLPALSGTITKGHYCIQVFDQGIITTPQTYTLRVEHP